MYKEKVEILLKPYISKKEIQIILECTLNEAEEILLNIQKHLTKNDFLIMNLYKVPTNLFMDLCNISIDEYVEKAKIEKEINNG